MKQEACDFLVIGAGSAGCVVASRLSENLKNRVLLLEAGGSDQKFWIRAPAGCAMTLSDKRVNWCYFADPDPGLNGRGAYFPRGKVIGGSGSINAMAYVRGLSQDFDDWERAGAAGWNWSRVRSTFEALECHREFDETGRRRTRGNGPVVVSDLSDRMHPFSQNFIAAARDLGWPVLADLNGDRAEGLALMRSTVWNSRRWSTADAFLRPARRRHNLEVVTGAHVERIVLDGGRVTGAVYRLGDRTVSARVTREVVLCAGAINSPKIMMLSGIGAPEDLRKHGIPVAHALPEVGRSLQDHLAVSYVFRTDRPTLNGEISSRRARLYAGLRYLLGRRGPLSVPVNQCGGFIRSAPDAAAPDVQIYCNPLAYATDASGRVRVDRSPGYTLSVQPCRPTSRGRVSLGSADPNAPPRIEPRALSTNEDCRMAIRAGQVLQTLAGSPSLAALTIERPAPDLMAMDDDALLEDFRARARSVFHASCTCRMGRDATESVVDGRLKVHGLAGMRVVDASAFPNVTSGNTNAPTIMLAQRGSEMILEDANLTHRIQP